MTRWMEDVFFQRVLCLILFLVILMFSLIITNVFVDIDGLITRSRTAHSPKAMPDAEDVAVHVMHAEYHGGRRPESHEEKHFYRDLADNGRNKRSIEPQGYNKKVRSSKMREVLTNRLASLLEELDGEETTTTERITSTSDHSDSHVTAATVTSDVRVEPMKTEEDFKHMALHNVLLKGIVGHMDMHDVYRRIHDLFETLKPFSDKPLPKHDKLEIDTISKENRRLGQTDGETKEEDKIIDELSKCPQLQRQLTENKDRPVNKTKKAPQVYIKTVIDISNGAGEKNVTSVARVADNIKGIINLLYNGKQIKFSQGNDERSSARLKATTETPRPEASTENSDSNPNSMLNDDTVKRQDILNKMIHDYFLRNRGANSVLGVNGPETFTSNNNDQSIHELESKRLKREVTTKYYNQPKGPNKHVHSVHKTKSIVPKNDDVFIEIETHFEDDGLLGEKKKKRIESLIRRIENAINVNNASSVYTSENTRKGKRVYQIRKRTQNPLEQYGDKANKTTILLKTNKPASTVMHRLMNPLSKTVPLNHITAETGNKLGHRRNSKYEDPSYYAATKMTNSAEKRELNGNYNAEAQDKISKREQEPILNRKGATAENADDMKFVIKDIDGTGFSIGISQYIDDAPDADQMKLFTNIEELIRTYHQTYDENESALESGAVDRNSSEVENKHKVSKRQASFRMKRSKHSGRNASDDHHYNEYKFIFVNNRENILPFEHYQDIYGDNNEKSSENENAHHINKISKKRNKLNHVKLNEAILNEISNKLLKPSEILSIANLIDSKRKKRFVHYKKISRVKTKNPLNKYIKIQNKPISRIIFKKGNRHKREARDKIRLYAGDYPKDSSEDVILVSDESVMADRALLNDQKIPSAMHEHSLDHEADRDFIPIPYFDNHFHPDSVLRNFFNNVRTSHNMLITKYPHSFLEGQSDSKEEPERSHYPLELMADGDNPRDNHIGQHQFANLLSFLPKSGQATPNSNYKVTVKILPKNGSDESAGFREVHTTINKTYNKGGMEYMTMLNIKEISKVERINKTDDHHGKLAGNDHEPKHHLDNTFREKDDRFKHLLRQQQEKIVAQLKKLEKEKDKIDKIIDSSVQHSTTTAKPDYNISAKDLLKMLVTQESNKPDNFNVEAIKHLFNMYPANNGQETMTHIKPSTIPHVTPNYKAVTVKTEKPIRREITDQALLKKIDKNTEVLEKILKTISKRHNDQPVHYVIQNSPVADILSPPPQHRNESYMRIIPDNLGIKEVLPPQNDSSNMPYLFPHPLPNLPPYHSPIASILYHGMLYNSRKPMELMDPLKESMFSTPLMSMEDQRPNKTGIATEGSKFFLDAVPLNPKPSIVNAGADKNIPNYNRYSSTLTVSRPKP